MSISKELSTKMKFSFEDINSATHAKTVIENRFPSVITRLASGNTHFHGNATLIVNSSKSINVDLAIEELITSVGGIVI